MGGSGREWEEWEEWEGGREEWEGGIMLEKEEGSMTVIHNTERTYSKLVAVIITAV